MPATSRTSKPNIKVCFDDDFVSVEDDFVHDSRIEASFLLLPRPTTDIFIGAIVW